MEERNRWISPSDTEEAYLPEGKTQYPTHPGAAPFKSLERFLDVAGLPDARDVVREVKCQAVKKLEILDQMHKELVLKAHKIIEKTREDLRLHNLRMHSAKIRGNLYYLYGHSDDENSQFFSILEPEDYRCADPDARFWGAYKLNEDGSWTQLDSDTLLG